MNTKDKIKTNEPITWCPGCPNFLILEAIKQTITNLIEKEKINQKDFAMTADIGCNSKIFDYLNLSGIYGLHGRALPTAFGIKLANPRLNVLSFAGDGAIYSEGISHLIHAFRYNQDMTLFVHNNQNFSLTTGQSTPTSQKGYIIRGENKIEENNPINPIKLALASNATFIARTNAKDIPHMVEIFTKAIKHKGFSYVEIMQDCLIFNKDVNNKDKLMYKIKDNYDYKKAISLAEEFDYNSKNKKIPLGIIYQKKEPTFLEKFK
ncbi:MAG: thiamine pyrophosphate-dependent enzyme [Candidatus Nanoarchaeia archaeon]|nr:thiamine pyrophosphate-dependent enzyme [Candidatus Nanoarchaeia archaeon]